MWNSDASELSPRFFLALSLSRSLVFVFPFSYSCLLSLCRQSVRRQRHERVSEVTNFPAFDSFFFCLCVPILAKIDFAYFPETLMPTFHLYARLHGVRAGVCGKQKRIFDRDIPSAAKTKEDMHSRSVTLHVRHGRQSIVLPFILLFYLNSEYPNSSR